jgi:hypothetical protein
MAYNVLVFLVPHERGQNRRSHVASLRCALCSDRSENLGWLMPIARSMHGWMALVRRLISGRLSAVGDLADFQGASDEHTLIHT